MGGKHGANLNSDYNGSCLKRGEPASQPLEEGYFLSITYYTSCHSSGKMYGDVWECELALLLGISPLSFLLLGTVASSSCPGGILRLSKGCSQPFKISKVYFTLLFSTFPQRKLTPVHISWLLLHYICRSLETEVDKKLSRFWEDTENRERSPFDIIALIPKPVLLFF